MGPNLPTELGYVSEDLHKLVLRDCLPNLIICRRWNGSNMLLTEVMNIIRVMCCTLDVNIGNQDLLQNCTFTLMDHNIADTWHRVFQQQIVLKQSEENKSTKPE